MMKKTILFFILACLPAGVLFSQVNEDKKAGFQLSFIPPLSTQGTLAPEYSNAVSFNILAGVSREVTVFSLSSLGMYVMDDLKGFHLSGLGTYAGGDGCGIMISGLFNKTNNYKGFQMSGLANLTKNEMNGFQFGGLLNKAGDMQGFQFAGLVNIAKDVKGLQLGLVNIAENNDCPIGLVNIIKDGEMSIGITYDEIGSTIVGFRSGGRILYGILGVGYNHKANDAKYVTEGGLGVHIPISSRFRINNELRSQFMTDFSDDEVNHTTFVLMPAFKITPNFEIFGGPSINYMSTDHIENKNLFPGNSLWKEYTDTKLKQLYVGFSAGVQYIF